MRDVMGRDNMEVLDRMSELSRRYVIYDMLDNALLGKDRTPVEEEAG